MGVCSFVNALCLTGLFSSFTKDNVAAYGWRPTYKFLGILELAIILPLGLIFMRAKPEAYGLLPDGIDPSLNKSQAKPGRMSDTQGDSESSAFKATPASIGNGLDSGDN